MDIYRVAEKLDRISVKKTEVRGALTCPDLLFNGTILGYFIVSKSGLRTMLPKIYPRSCHDPKQAWSKPGRDRMREFSVNVTV
ncbi:hypothetical protein [Paenibacillus larvae]|uniref:hypothetical protein n=1 Tax=Paenibacillus larvae TaxID=1464 RepID=UPI002890B8EA|nr:hypothetical protein [Paenibacillus larvae]MDT2193409.1 hypothetical protein [Paenibacillus larvae]